MTAMTLEQLRIFVAVAEREHMTRAAEALNLTQSATSAAVAALEARYATTLFHRIGRRIELTAAGRVFLEEARGVLARAAAAELALAELGGLTRGTLAVQASQTIAGYWLPPRLVAYHDAHPDIDLELTIGNTAEAVAAVAAGHAELGFVEGPVDHQSLTLSVIARDRMMIVVGRGHPWAGRQRIDPGELTNSPWVLREPGSGTRSAFEAALTDFGIALSALDVAMELPSNEAVRAAVEAGAGATALSELVAMPSLASGRLSPVGFDLPERPFYVLRHSARYHSRAADALLKIIAQRNMVTDIWHPTI
jgi:DNA-binding transcriptional LysR family regulator